MKSTDNVNRSTVERLNELLKEKGKNQAWLARKLSISPSSISYWLSGQKMPSRENVRLLAQVLGCSPSYILGYTDYRTEEEEKAMHADLAKHQMEIRRKREKKIYDLIKLSCKIGEDADWIYLVKGGISARLYRHQINELSEGLLDMIDTYVDHFIKQHKNIVE